MNLPMPAFKVLCLLCAAVLISACDENDSGQAPLQPVAELPQEFVDSLGRTWLCEQPQGEASITGTVSLENPPSSLQNTDLLHLTLFEQNQNQQLQSVTSYCINNISKLPIAFSLHYNPADIDPERSYGISANYFEWVVANGYAASHKFDGLKPVITNGETEQVDIVLPAASESL